VEKIEKEDDHRANTRLFPRKEGIGRQIEALYLKK
jgi:hypothetical protein